MLLNNSNILLSIIIVTYKSGDEVCKCLDTISEYNDIGDNVEIIIVDNSPEGYQYPLGIYDHSHISNIKIIKNDNNGGYGQGNNIGARIAEGEYLLFLNPDTHLIEEIFGFAIDRFKNDINLAFFGIKIIADINSFCFFKKPSFFFRKEFLLFPCIFLNRLFDHLDLFFPNLMVTTGACMFMRKSVFFEAGMFDENIFLFCEESYIARKIKLVNKNYKIGFFPQKEIVHMGTSSLPLSLRTRLALKSQAYFLKKFGFFPKRYLISTLIYIQLKILFSGFFFIKQRLKNSLDEFVEVKREIKNW